MQLYLIKKLKMRTKSLLSYILKASLWFHPVAFTNGRSHLIPLVIRTCAKIMDIAIFKMLINTSFFLNRIYIEDCLLARYKKHDFIKIMLAQYTNKRNQFFFVNKINLSCFLNGDLCTLCAHTSDLFMTWIYPKKIWSLRATYLSSLSVYHTITLLEQKKKIPKDSLTSCFERYGRTV